VCKTALFQCRFCNFSWLEAYLPPLTPSTTTPYPCSPPPPDSRRTKRFLSRLHGPQLFLIEGAELSTTAAAWRHASLSPIGCLESYIYMTPSRMATSIFKAIRIRVNKGSHSPGVVQFIHGCFLFDCFLICKGSPQSHCIWLVPYFKWLTAVICSGKSWRIATYSVASFECPSHIQWQGLT
jgi:hypothetical protein